MNIEQENEFETNKESQQLFGTIYGDDEENFQLNGRRPCSQSQRCQQKTSKATQVAAQNACQKNAREFFWGLFRENLQ